MKLLLCLVLAVFAAAVIAQRNSFSLTALDWSTATSLSFGIFPVATKKDLLVYLDASNSELSVMAVRRRNNEGVYVHVANFTEQVSPFASTNGKWVALQGEGNYLFNIDENNNLSNSSFIPTIGGFLLSDDTFVGFDPVSENGDGNYTIRTYEYSTENKNWTEITGTELVVPFVAQSIADISSYRATDTHLVIVDYSNPESLSVRIYNRLANLSWSLTENVPVNSTLSEINSPHYNGVDTLVYSLVAEEGGSIGIVFIYTKINGQWVEQKFTTESVDYRPVGYLGLSIAFVDANNILISAGLEGYTGGSGTPTSAGKVLFVTRGSDGKWEPALDLVGPNLFGLGVGVNDHDIVVPSLLVSESSTAGLTFYVAPRCFAQPINVTCSNQQVNDCSDVDISEMYTINNPQCGAITANLNGFSLVNNQAISAEFTFTRGYGADFSCNATVTCPAPPVAANNNVNSAIVLQLGLASLLVSAAVLFL
jgi:hypothetical protein